MEYPLRSRCVNCAPQPLTKGNEHTSPSESTIKNAGMNPKRCITRKLRGAGVSQLLAIESAGVFAALLRAIGVVRIDLAGIAAAIAAAAVAWLSLKQHESLARAYAYAAIELALATTRLQNVTDEEEWSSEVDNAESAISREHTMWRANRTTI